jgi:hypothetical protein
MRVTIPSVDYGDFLAVTLPAWRTLLPYAQFTVVTSPEDRETISVATAEADRVLVTDAWRSDGAQFNKAAALDLAFGFAGEETTPPEAGEVCLSIDADVHPFGKLREDRVLAEAIHGCPRYFCRTARELWAHRRGRVGLRAFPLMLGKYRDHPSLLAFPNPAMVIRTARSAIGYFQLWRHRPGLDRFGSYPTASTYDVVFAKSFRTRRPLTGFYVLHLGVCSQRNWTGRVMPRWGGEVTDAVVS